MLFILSIHTIGCSAFRHSVMYDNQEKVAELEAKMMLAEQKRENDKKKKKKDEELRGKEQELEQAQAKSAG